MTRLLGAVEASGVGRRSGSPAPACGLEATGIWTIPAGDSCESSTARECFSK